jgi:glyoxylase-like metal-dependent hydrolase (beta-lactamase superfamily II)
VQRWKIGDVIITKVVESELVANATWILPDASAENLAPIAWCRPHFVSQEGLPVLSFHALCVESQGQCILVDTCVGNDKTLPRIPRWHKQQGGSFLADLARAGFAPDSVDTVLCTHLHMDHVGWNTRLENGRWVPTFAKARYLWNSEEYEHWWSVDQEKSGPVFGESVAPIFDAGLVDLVEADTAVTEEIRLEPTPGHTPGHVAVHIESRGEEAVITGDLVHHPCQLAHPEWGSSADWRPERAEATRRAFFARYSDRPVLVIGTHFAGPTAGHIVRDGDAWRLDA